MEISDRKYSLFNRLSLCLVAAYAILLLLMLVNDVYAIHTIKDGIHAQLSNLLQQESRQISTELNDVSAYLATVSLKSPDFSTVELNLQDTGYYSSLYKVKTELTSTLNSMSLIKGLFIFPMSSQQLIYASADYATADSLREWLRGKAQSGDLSKQVSRFWFTWENTDGHVYLLRLLKVSNSYVGAWTDFGTLLSRTEQSSWLSPIALFVYDEKHTYNIDSLPASFQMNPFTNMDTSMIHLDRRYISMSASAPFTKSGAFFLLADERQITHSLRDNYLLIASIGIFFIAAVLVTAYIILNHLKRPLNQLQASLHRLRSGDFSIRLPQNHTASEFQEVNQAFNEMVERIADLKISIYEERLNQQKTEMLALKNQIAPHFLINCLNAIYHMAAANNTSGIQNMAVYLGEHLRYALADIPMVSLQEEINKVINYVELSKIRFKGSIALHLSIPENLNNTPVLPMLLLFQVENIIKYQVVNGQLTEIHIEAYQERSDEKAYLHCVIWDTGTGYLPEILSQLNSPHMLSQAGGHNIGTKNTYQRLHLTYQNDFILAFSNKPNAGAQVDIRFPLNTEQLRQKEPYPPKTYAKCRGSE